MPINIESESVLTLEEAKKAVPRRHGRHPSVATLWRWCRRGIKGVRLEYIRVGRTIITSKEAIARFFEAMAAADKPLGPTPPPPQHLGSTPSARRASLADADRILDEAGI